MWICSHFFYRKLVANSNLFNWFSINSTRFTIWRTREICILYNNSSLLHNKQIVIVLIRDDPIYFVRFELPLIPLIDWNLEILHKCHNYFDLYKLLLISKSILVALFWTPYFFLSALVAFFGLSCPLQSWKHQHTNEKCYQNNILCLVNKNYDFFCNLLINFISNYQI